VNKRLLVPLALLIATALTLTACGGSSDSDKVTEVIEEAATTSEPSNCTELETQRFVEQNSQEKGQAAVETCEKEAEEDEGKAKSVTVSNVAVEGEKATAEVEFEGGSLNSQALELALVEEGGSWKLDYIEGFAKYDGAALGEAFRQEFEKNPEEVSQAQANCIAREISKASQKEAEALFFAGSPKAIVELARGCA
jgi:copper chaperone CopZ